MTYNTRDQVKAWLRIGTAITTDDAIIDTIGSAVSRAIDDYCDRKFTAAGTVASARYYAADNADLLTIDDVGSLTGFVLEVDTDLDGTYDTTLTTSDYQTEPHNAITKGDAVWRLRIKANASNAFPVSTDAAVKVTARWGWPSVPEPVKEAHLLQCARVWARRQAPLGSIQAPELGGGERLLSRLDPDVQVMLDPFRRTPFGIGPP